MDTLLFNVIICCLYKILLLLYSNNKKQEEKNKSKNHSKKRASFTGSLSREKGDKWTDKIQKALPFPNQDIVPVFSLTCLYPL